MKQIVLVCGLLIASLTSFSQITITSADLPSANDTVIVSESTQYSTVDFTTTGANQVWDFSDLIADSQRIDTFFALNGASFSYQAVFNNAFTNAEYESDYYNNLTGSSIPEVPGGFVTIEDPIYFTKNSTNSSSIVGLGLKINGNEVPAEADTIDVVYHYPLNYGDSWDSTSYIYLDFNPAFNGMFKRHQYRTSETDGWGEITTPFGTFDVIRVKSTITYVDSIYVDFGAGGSWNELATPQDVEHSWLTNNNKIPVLKIVAQGGSATSIEYRDHEVEFGASIDEKSTFDFGVYPNPANDLVSITVNENEISLVEVMDVSGKVVYSNEMMSSTHNINVSAWSKGIYVVRLTNNNKVSTQSLVIN